jgi:hypothetical protein
MVEIQGRTTGENGAVFNPRDISIESAPKSPAWLSSDIVIGIALALLVAVVGWGLLRLLSNNSDDSSATPVATNAPFAPAVTNTAPQPSSEAEAPTPTFDANIEGVQLDLEATEHVWVRVTVDGVVVLEGILAPPSVAGTPQTWQGTQQIKLEAANGAGLQATVNGQPLGALGERGQQVILAWGPDGPVSP